MSKVLLSCSVYLGTGVNKLAPIKAALIEGKNKSLGGGNVCGKRNVVHVTKAKQIGFVGFAQLPIDGVTEQKEKVNFIAPNSGGNLLVAPLGSA